MQGESAHYGNEEKDRPREEGCQKGSCQESAS
jgi:hypothetical protein